MKTNEKRRVASKLTAYPLGMLQDFITFARLCERENVSLEEVREYIRAIFDENNGFTVRAQNYQLEMEKAAGKFPVCPFCKNHLAIQPVNDDLARMVDDHSHSWWVCPDVSCPFEPELSDKYPYEIMSDMGIMVRKPRKPASSRRRKKAAKEQLGSNKRG